MTDLRHPRVTPYVGSTPMKPVRRRKPVEVDAEALAAVKADLDARAAALQRPAPAEGGKRTLTPKGACYDCGRAVTGERRYCGTCLAKH